MELHIHLLFISGKITLNEVPILCSIEYILNCIDINLDPMTDFPEHNTILDAYRIIKEIGRGGMARIFEAEHTVTGQRCALKILAPSDEAYRMSERFLQEFKAFKVKTPQCSHCI